MKTFKQAVGLLLVLCLLVTAVPFGVGAEGYLTVSAGDTFRDVLLYESPGEDWLTASVGDTFITQPGSAYFPAGGQYTEVKVLSGEDVVEVSNNCTMCSFRFIKEGTCVIRTTVLSTDAGSDSPDTPLMTKSYSFRVSSAPDKPTIIRQPASVYAADGSSVSFDTEAEGGLVQYRWLVCNKERTSEGYIGWDRFEEETGAIARGTSSRHLSINRVSSAADGYYVWCEITNDNGSVWTDYADIRVVDFSLKATSMLRQTVRVREKAELSVRLDGGAEPNNVIYQWYARTAGGTFDKVSLDDNEMSPVYTVTGTNVGNAEYYCTAEYTVGSGEGALTRTVRSEIFKVTTVLGEVADDQIPSVEIDYELPLFGAFLMPPSVEVAPDEASVNSAMWYSSETGTAFGDFHQTEDGSFNSKHEYAILLRLSAPKGKSFSRSTCFILNGSVLTGDLVNFGSSDPVTQVTLLCPLGKPSRNDRITSLSVDNVKKPSVGALPTAENITLDKNVKTVAIEWRESDTGDDYESYHAFAGAFRENAYYGLWMKLDVEGEREFSRNIKAVLNDKVGTQAFVRFNAQGQLLLLFPLDKLEKPSAQIVPLVELNGFRKPELGAIPAVALNLSVSTNAPYRFDGIEWLKNGHGIDYSSVFEPACAYKANLYFTVNDGYSIEDMPKVTIDGSTDYVSVGSCRMIGDNKLRVTTTEFRFAADAAPVEEPTDETYVFPFTDVAEGAWYFNDVRIAHKNGLVNGKTESLYCPDDNMTIAEAVKLAACMNQLYYDKKVTLVNGEGNWYDTYFDYCLEKEILGSDYRKTDRANVTITRKMFVNIFYKALPADAYETINKVAYNAIPDIFESSANEAIYTFYRAGILTGSDELGTFNPDSAIRRSEVAAILTRMFDESARKSVVLNG